MKTYVCTRTVHCGEVFQEGDEIELDPEGAEAVSLLELGAIKDPDAKEPKAAPVREPKRVAKKK